MAPLMSICIPTYNRCDELGRVLGEISAQMEELGDVYKDKIEVIVSDNGSSDKTRDVVLLYSKKIPSLRFNFFGKNHGFGLNLNKTLAMSRGAYIWLVGSDDLPSPKTIGNIMSLVESLDQNDAPSVILLNAFSEDGKRRRLFKKESGINIDIFDIKDLLCFIRNCREFSAAFSFMSIIVARREVLTEEEMSSEELSHPYAHTLRIFKFIAHGLGVRKLKILTPKGCSVRSGVCKNEWNSSRFTHFRLDLETSRYIGDCYFLSHSMRLRQEFNRLFMRHHLLARLLTSPPDSLAFKLRYLRRYGVGVGALFVWLSYNVVYYLRRFSGVVFPGVLDDY